MRLVSKICLTFLLAFPLTCFGQERKITLHPDTTDAFSLCYTRGIYTIMMGYDTFYKNLKLDSVQQRLFKTYTDSVVESIGTVDLNPFKKLTKHCADGAFVVLYVNVVGETMANTMLGNGNAKVFNTVSKKYITQVLVKTGKGKRIDEGREVKATAVKYYDPNTNTEIFEYVY